MSIQDIEEQFSRSISRRWEQYLVKAVLSETKSAEIGRSWPERTALEIQTHKGLVRRDFETQFFVLPTPIVVETNQVMDILEIMTSDRMVRIYPPFALNEQNDRSAALKDIVFPEGVSKIERASQIPSHAVTGVRATHRTPPGTSWCRGLRIDVQLGADVGRVIGLLIDHLSQYTHQWWLRGSHNPFFGIKQLGAAMDNDFKPLQLFEYKGADKIESPWYGAVEFQPALGIVAPISKEVWLHIGQHLNNGDAADIGILGMHDAFSDYMAGRDEKCILNLCISVEILLSKHRRIKLGKEDNEKLDKMIRTTKLVDDRTKQELKTLMIDRGHVAHGRAPYMMGRDPQYTIERYILAARKLLLAYLADIPADLWPKFMNMKLDGNAR